MFNSSSLFDPIFVALISLGIPGLGHLIVGYEKKGLYFLFVYVVLWLGTELFESNLILSISFFVIISGVSIYAAYDAYKLTKKKINSPLQKVLKCLLIINRIKESKKLEDFKRDLKK